jgi:signal transduction histidine kinase
MSALSIRLRLAVLYTLVLGLSLVMTDLLVYFGLERYLASQLDQALAAQAAEIAGITRVETNITIGGVRLLGVVLPNLDVFSSAGLYVEAVNRNGQLQARSANLDQAQIPAGPVALAAALAGAERYETVTIGSTRLRLVYAPLRVDGDVVGALILARSRLDLDSTLAQLRVSLTLIGLLSLALAGLSGWWLARAALRPIDRLTRAARAIGEQRDFTRRVAEVRTGDEVGRLATTFNAMLAELESAHAELAQALEIEQRFVADASHELRTPLATIRGNIELLQRVEDLAPADREAALADALAETDRLARLVADLLTLARADAGLHLELRPVRLDELLRDVYRQARLLALSREQRVALADSPPITVHGNADALRQLLLVLVDNAVKYGPDGGEIRLALTSGGSRACLTVSDDGPGVAPEHQWHLFERFYRADQARAGGGTGLGLAIAKWIVDEHGGQIKVDSGAGGGSTFTVELRVSGTTEEPTRQRLPWS